MQKIGSLASILLALSIAYLASSIFYIGSQLSLLGPLVDEVDKMRQFLPDVMTEVAAVRKEIPSIVAEVAAVRQEIPSVVAEVAAVRKMVPAVLAEAEQVRKLIPPVLAEVKTTREAIPGMLDRAEGVVDGAGNAGEKATRGAITGVLTGILGAPINVMQKFTHSLLGTTELEKEDLSQISDASDKVLSTDKVGASEAWSNAKNSTKGTVELLRKTSLSDKDCRVLRVISSQSGKQLTDAEITLCHLPSGEWELQQKP